MNEKQIEQHERYCKEMTDATAQYDLQARILTLCGWLRTAIYERDQARKDNTTLRELTAAQTEAIRALERQNVKLLQEKQELERR